MSGILALHAAQHPVCIEMPGLSLYGASESRLNSVERQLQGAL
ncbi:hypothetical protein [Rhodoferax sp.]|nr:hypothetical protein [Rhodoferax sp.]